MDTAFDPRLRFIILWVLAETWFALALSAATPYLAQGGNYLLLQALSFLTVPVAAAGQMLLLRGRVAPAWLWLAAGFGSAVLLFVLFRILVGGVFAGVLPQSGGGLPAWMPYLVLSGVVAGLALALPQALAIARWSRGPASWFFIVLGAAVIASVVGGVIWVMGGMGGAAGLAEGAPWAALVAALARHVAFGGITGFYMWQRLAQRSVDAAASGT
ncbi:MAG: hypothetical protein AB7O63_04650 [Reyranellaceae bacterium]